MTDCLLVNASISDSPAVPLGVLWLAASLRQAGHSVTAIDYQVSGLTPLAAPATLARFCLQWDCRVIGLSVTCASLPTVLGAVRLIREGAPRALIVLGGPGVSDRPDLVMERFPVDFIVAGEGEHAAARLLTAIRQGRDPAGIPGVWSRRGEQVVAAVPPRRIDSLDRLAVPDYGEIDFNRYGRRASVVITRGCPHSCTFCSAHSVWGRRVCSRGADRVSEELRSLEGYVDVVEFHDDTLLGDPRRGVALMKQVRESGFSLPWACNCRADRFTRELGRALSELGCMQVLIGAESGSDRMLEAMRKGTSVASTREAIAEASAAVGRVTSSYIWGFAEETYDEMVDTLMCVAADHRLPGVSPQLALLSAVPGAEATRRASGLKFDHSLNPGGMVPSGVSLADYPELLDLILTHPDLFSAHYYFDHPTFDAKLQLVLKFCASDEGN